ncbi:uncharacterized protein N7482_000038 [Penicillium canariense]|uniref:Uncharacterized protein n=1 Tax=Penicillium canariense TaxID=189055 RepID=A0A9W9IH35_9EURO|nr:uncharacterized protein N7482_000038 [Penicillium canariense]KAJ5174161.1 hypothetical protein N7482_000038 [Penicillium canariense]
MLDWDNDKLMSEWDKTYVSTNVKPGARPYDRGLFLKLNDELFRLQPELQTLSHAIIAAACCAVGRADVVGRFFDDITTDASPEYSENIFLCLREAITIIFPYLGMPTCIPACYGMVGVVQRKGPEYASTRVLRKDTIGEDDVHRGRVLRDRIYSGVGNSQIFGLMDQYFTDLFTCSTVVTWGYLIAKANEEVFQPNESHLIIVTAIAALGATRQARSHIKATLGIQNTVDSVKAVLQTVMKISEWADRPIHPVDVDGLAEQMHSTARS